MSPKKKTQLCEKKLHAAIVSAVDVRVIDGVYYGEQKKVYRVIRSHTDSIWGELGYEVYETIKHVK